VTAGREVADNAAGAAAPPETRQRSNTKSDVCHQILTLTGGSYPRLRFVVLSPTSSQPKANSTKEYYDGYSSNGSNNRCCAARDRCRIPIHVTTLYALGEDPEFLLSVTMNVAHT
jgi:hypothetical protein